MSGRKHANPNSPSQKHPKSYRNFSGKPQVPNVPQNPSMEVKKRKIIPVHIKFQGTPVTPLETTPDPVETETPSVVPIASQTSSPIFEANPANEQDAINADEVKAILAAGAAISNAEYNNKQAILKKPKPAIANGFDSTAPNNRTVTVESRAISSRTPSTKGVLNKIRTRLNEFKRTTDSKNIRKATTKKAKPILSKTLSILDKTLSSAGLVSYTAVNLAFATLKSALFLLRTDFRHIGSTYQEFGQKTNRFYNRFIKKSEQVKDLTSPKCNSILKTEFKALKGYSVPIKIWKAITLAPIALVDFTQCTFDCALAGLDYLFYPFLPQKRATIENFEKAIFNKDSREEVNEPKIRWYSKEEAIVNKENHSTDTPKPIPPANPAKRIQTHTPNQRRTPSPANQSSSGKPRSSSDDVIEIAG